MLLQWDDLRTPYLWVPWPTTHDLPFAFRMIITFFIDETSSLAILIIFKVGFPALKLATLNIYINGLEGKINKSLFSWDCFQIVYGNSLVYLLNLVHLVLHVPPLLLINSMTFLILVLLPPYHSFSMEYYVLFYISYLSSLIFHFLPCCLYDCSIIDPVVPTILVFLCWRVYFV